MKFLVKNESKRAVRVQAIQTSCGCTTVQNSDYWRPPFDLRPGASFPCIVTTRAQFRPGTQSYVLNIESTQDGQVLPASTARLSFVVRDKMRAYPDAISLENYHRGTTLIRKVMLGEIGQQRPAHVVAAASSNPEIVAVSFCALDGRSRRPGQIAERYELTCTIALGEREQINERITVLLDDGSSLQLPVYGRADTPVSLRPNRLIIRALRPGEMVERSVFFGFDDARDRALTVVELPENVRVEIDPFGRDKSLVKIRYTRPESNHDKQSVVFEAGRDSARLTLTIELEGD